MSFDVLVCWRLDRLGRNLRHLVTLLDELQAVGVSFVSLGEGIDCTTPAGRLQLDVLAALAEFERARIAERVRAGLARAKQQGKRLGRPETVIPESVLAPVRGLSVREAASRLGGVPVDGPPVAGGRSDVRQNWPSGVSSRKHAASSACKVARAAGREVEYRCVQVLHTHELRRVFNSVSRNHAVLRSASAYAEWPHRSKHGRGVMGATMPGVLRLIGCPIPHATPGA